jgi:hypothetical protein
MLRHPTDGSQWRKVNTTFPTFADDARNVRFGLSTDGVNPFGEQRSGHSTWPVTLCIYNRTPWLCMKRKFIIDVYLKPLVDDLLMLWKEEGVHVWDAHTEEHFDLCALLFITIGLHLATCSNISIRVIGHAPVVYMKPTTCV